MQRPAHTPSLKVERASQGEVETSASKFGGEARGVTVGAMAQPGAAVGSQNGGSIDDRTAPRRASPHADTHEGKIRE
eukprot:scaffold211398_cov27-Tisochrysis_lutea.AAC.2